MNNETQNTNQTGKDQNPNTGQTFNNGQNPNTGFNSDFGNQGPNYNRAERYGYDDDHPTRDNEQKQNSVVIRRYTDSDIFDVHKHGVIDGVMEIPAEPYSAFQVWLEKELTANKHEIARLDNEIAQLKRKIAQDQDQERLLHEQLHQKQAERDTLVHILDELNAKRRQLEAEKEKTEKDIEKYMPSTAWPSIALLIIAAIAFVAGEIIVNIKIVADAFNMEGEQGYIFAIGLAAVSVLLKPAYDRLLEKPYLENRPKITRSFVVVMTLVSIFAVMTAYLLGEFRFDTEALNKITEIGEQTRKAAGDKLNQIEQNLEIESIVGWVPKFSFIFAAILFAIGGTVCLSIALTALEYQSRRNKAEKRLTTVKGEITEKTTEIAKQTEAKNKTEAEIKSFAQKIDKIPKIETQENKLRELRAERMKKVWEAAQYEWEGAVALYRNAYERGKAIKEFHRENPEIWRNFYAPQREPEPETADDNFINIETFETVETESGEKKNVKRRTPVRPYQALKLAIGAKFRNDCQSRGFFDPKVKNYDVEV